MSKTDLNAIVTRLRDLARTTASTAPALPSIPPPPSIAQPAAISPPRPVLPLSPQFSPNVSTDALSSALSSMLSQPTVPAVPLPAMSFPAPVPISSTTPSVPVPDVSQLFKSLVAAGLISGHGSASVGASMPAPSQLDDSPKFEPIIEHKPALVDAKLVSMREYEKRILSLPVSLSASGLQRCVFLLPVHFREFDSSYVPTPNCSSSCLWMYRPQRAVVSMIYEELPLKCKQCARRFADNEAGQRARDDHLDLHFRQNKRASQSIGRGHTRSWFVGVEVCIRNMTKIATASHTPHLLYRTG